MTQNEIRRCAKKSQDAQRPQPANNVQSSIAMQTVLAIISLAAWLILSFLKGDNDQ